MVLVKKIRASKVSTPRRKSLAKNPTAMVKGKSEEEQQLLNIKPTTIKKALEGVIKFTKENPKLKNQLFEDEEFPLMLQINCFRVPKMLTKIVRIRLEHSLLTAENEVCLIVPDVKGVPNAEHEKHLEHYEQLLRAKGVANIQKIMTFHQFRTEYDTFEMKKKLVELYDVFLVDGRIGGKVVKKCGKIFYKKRKVPTSIKLQATKLKQHIEETLNKTPLYLHGKGDSFTVQFGHSKMGPTALAENVTSVLQGLKAEFPGGLDNIRNLHVYTFRGLPIPIYTSLRNPNDIEIAQEDQRTKRVPKKIKTVTGELTTRLNAQVTVEPTGEVTVEKVVASDGEDEDEDVLQDIRRLEANIAGNNQRKRRSKKPTAPSIVKTRAGRTQKRKLDTKSEESSATKKMKQGKGKKSTAKHSPVLKKKKKKA